MKKMFVFEKKEQLLITNRIAGSSRIQISRLIIVKSNDSDGVSLTELRKQSKQA